MFRYLFSHRIFLTQKALGLLLVYFCLFLSFPLFVCSEQEQIQYFKMPPQQEVLRLKSALIETERGNIYIELFPEEAPLHVVNFKYLSDQGYYQDKEFHLVKPDYIVQGGATLKDPDIGPGYTLLPEFNRNRHIRGALGMARRPDISNPGRRSHGGQFHIFLTEVPQFDGAFTVFGRVLRGMEIVEKIKEGDKIINITVFVREN